MIEILSRDGLGRLAKWTAGEAALVTPDILFLDALDIPHFARGEGYLSARPSAGTASPAPGLPKKRFIVAGGGSWFLENGPSPNGAEATIAPFPNIPAGLEGAQGEAFAASLESFHTTGSKALGIPGGHPYELGSTGAEVLVFAGALELSFQPRRLARELVALKEAALGAQAVYAPGMGEPGHIAILAYCGVDIFDSSPLLAAARRGVRLFPAWKAGPEEKGICHCPACEIMDAGAGGRGPGAGDDDGITSSCSVPAPGTRPPAPDLVYLHNCYAAAAEAAKVRMAIRRGRLRELVEQRLSEPWLAALLRHMDLRHAGFCERYFPVARPSSSAGMIALGRASLHRPEAARFRSRVLERQRRPPSAPVLLLLPCSARKPYSTSLSHRLFRGYVIGCGNPGAVHMVVVTSPLGVVPMELESFYPANSYDITVTGDWDEEEKKILREQLRLFLHRGGYSSVICHLSGMDFLKDALPPSTVFTGGTHPTRRASLEAMATELSEAVRDLPKVGGKTAGAERMASLCRFQFGEGGEALVAGCDIWRMGPELRFILPDRQHTQVGMLSPERGLVSLTLPGGGRLAGRTGYDVAIDDFKPSGTVFAAGILKAGEVIRPGDEVVITHDGRLRAVGTAVMSGPEMARSDRGAAVRVRHHVR
jgi:archaeosine synthase